MHTTCCASLSEGVIALRINNISETTSRPTSKRHDERRGLLLAVALGGLVTALPSAAQSNNQVVRVIVPYPPGGATDLIARALAQALTAKWKKSVIVDNRAGAAGMLGAEAVARSSGDGATLLLTDATPVVVAPHLPSAQYKFDPLKSLAPIALVARQTPVIVVSKDIPANNIGAFIDYARRSPGLPYASIGTGSSFHIAMEQFQGKAGVSMLHVPYKGTGPLLTDLLGGQVKAAMLTLPSVNDFDRDKRLKILGVVGDVPAKGREDLPVIGASSLPGYQVNLWFGLFASSKTPSAMLESLHSDVVDVLDDPTFAKATLVPQFLVAGKESRKEFSDIMKADDIRWANLIKTYNVKE